jgi:FkbM family methyltransferase
LDFKAVQRAIAQFDNRPQDGDSRQFKHLRRLVYGEMVAGLLQDLRKDGYRNGADTLKLLEFGLPLVKQSKAQLFQDLWALYELDSKRGGFFVEFGAASGVELSNTWMLEKHYGWTGILAEPNPDFHASIRANRACTLSIECVYSTSGQIVPFRRHAVGEFSGVCLDADAVSRGFDMVEVPTITLNDLLDKHGAPKVIDYMSIDTEGSELEILQAFDFDRWDVRLISVEHNYGPNREPLLRLLKAAGYKRTFAELSQFDDWYVRRT